MHTSGNPSPPPPPIHLLWGGRGERVIFWIIFFETKAFAPIPYLLFAYITKCFCSAWCSLKGWLNCSQRSQQCAIVSAWHVCTQTVRCWDLFFYYCAHSLLAFTYLVPHIESYTCCNLKIVWHLLGADFFAVVQTTCTAECKLIIGSVSNTRKLFSYNFIHWESLAQKSLDQVGISNLNHDEYFSSPEVYYYGGDGELKFSEEK